MHNVVVTGGSRGIGLGIARRAGRGRLQRDRGRAPRERRTATGDWRGGGAGQRRLHFRAFDLSATDGIPAFVKELRDEVGAIYGPRQQCGHRTEGLLATMHNRDIEALVRLNVLSPVILTKYVVRHMMADGAGRHHQHVSIIASTGYNGLSVLRRHQGRRHRFHPLPGARGRQARDHRQRDRARLYRYRTDAEPFRESAPAHRGRSALRRLPDVDDVARMVEYLLGEGGRNITGSVQTIDAGNTA